jgi:hypothetical protein
MSRSETRATAVVDDAAAAGVLSVREADYWRRAVKDPCGCAEGLAAATLASAAVTVVRHDSLREVVLAGATAFAVGAVVGKMIGVAKGLPLARHQRSGLDRRLAELKTAAS